MGDSRTTCTGGVVDGTPGCPAEGGDRVLPPGGPGRRARRADGEATRVLVLRRQTRAEVVQDQARGPLGSRDYGSRMGERPTGRLAVELLARRTGRQGRRVPDDWEDVQGPHGCGVPGDDGAVARPRDVRGALGIPCATRDGGRGRVQRDPTKPALPERIRTSLRAHCAHSRRQRATGRRHIRAAQGPLRETVRTEGPGPGRSLTRAVAGTTRARWAVSYLYLEVYSASLLEVANGLLHVPRGEDLRSAAALAEGGQIDAEERIIQQGDALTHPSAEEEVEPGHHATAEGEDVRVQEAPCESVVGEGDRYDAGEAEDDSDGHPPVQALAEDVVREEADHQRMGRHEDDRRRDGLPLDLQRGDPQGEVGREDAADQRHDGRVAPRNPEERVLTAKDSAAHEDRRPDDERGDGEAVQGDRDGRRGAPRDEDRRERDGDDRKGDRRVRASPHRPGTGPPLSNPCAVASQSGLTETGARSFALPSIPRDRGNPCR